MHIIYHFWFWELITQTLNSYNICLKSISFVMKIEMGVVGYTFQHYMRYKGLLYMQGVCQFDRLHPF